MGNRENIVDTYEGYFEQILDLETNPLFDYEDIAFKANCLIARILDELNPDSNNYIRRFSWQFFGLVRIAFDCFHYILSVQEAYDEGLYKKLIAILPRTIDEADEIDKKHDLDLPF